MGTLPCLADDGDDKKADAENDSAAPRQPPFVVSIFRFQETIDAIRQLHDEVCVHAAELDRKHAGPEGLSAVQSLDPERREKFKEWLESRFEKTSEPVDKESSDKALREVFVDNPAAVDQARLMLQRAMLAPNREMLLRSSLLTMAVSGFEVLLGGLAAR